MLRSQSSIQSRRGEVAIRTAVAVKPKREQYKKESLFTEQQFKDTLATCTQCNQCAFVCPPHIRISEMTLEAVKGNLEPFSSTYEVCVGCQRCEQTCPQEIPILKLYEYANREYIRNQKFKMRAGRGPVLDIEIRKAGARPQPGGRDPASARVVLVALRVQDRAGRWSPRRGPCSAQSGEVAQVGGRLPHRWQVQGGTYHRPARAAPPSRA